MAGQTKTPEGDARIDERWHEILDAVAAVQTLLPDATMIGGSAVTVHTGHRLSGDADLVLRNLDRNWQQVRSGLEELQDWITDYPKIPTNLMGRYGDARVSVRKLNRLRDIEISEISYKGRTLRVAAPDELVRMKGLALLNRGLARDYVDIAALDEGLREAGSSAAHAIAEFDAYYQEQKSAGSLARELIAALSDPRPRESNPQAALNELAALQKDLQDWDQVRIRCQQIAADVE
ncbi:hypothetical protein EEB14_33925 [Rhodococcus sp. WS4]|nr:hypothetical protein EEB14_33925 [Rhodococcus sp. WS4]